PYIQRKSAGDYTTEDRERYQSIFAKHKGSAAAPTASFHFSEKLMEAIKAKGVETATITLHVSRDTFLPIREEDVTQHKMHGERFHVPKETQEKIAQTKKNGGRVIAIGTTAVRALESDWSQPITTHYIYPGYKFKVVDGILTNFHQPGSTLILLVAAFAGRDFLLQSYREAISERYRLFSYGDCMLIL
ncbi:MAG: S-adenosylmethionine:tRNA ribosyltransferase-isomerase, partial [Deltaproteobacteria bacterium]|nr:S-adenosylmethionine:tRNA ribosyltransferase-isomerase [Deltaproteobacteria bacterium]